MGKKKSKQNVGTFYMECEQWLKKNKQSIESAIRNKANERIGPIGPHPTTKVYCGKIVICALSVPDIHDPQLEAQIQYTLCDEKRCYTLKKTVRAELSSPLDTNSIKRRLRKNLTKQLKSTASAVAAGKITKGFLSAEAENIISDNPLPAKDSKSGALESAKQQPPKTKRLTIKDIQDAFCSIKYNNSRMLNIKKYLRNVFSEYSIKDAFIDISISTEACKGGVCFKAVTTLFFPVLQIPLPSIAQIVNIEDCDLSSKTKGECLNFFEEQAKAGLGELLKEQFNVFAKRQFFYTDCRDATPIDPNYSMKILLERIKEALTPRSEDMLQVHWKGMEYEPEKSALFVGFDGNARVYVDGIGRPVYVGTIPSLSKRFFEDRMSLPVSDSNNCINIPFPDTIFGFTEFMTALFQNHSLDLKIVIDVDPRTIKPVSLKIGYAEYYPDQPCWPFSEQMETAQEFCSKLRSEAASQCIIHSSPIDDQKLTNADITILRFVQKNPYGGESYVMANTDIPELSEEGKEFVFKGIAGRFLNQKMNNAYCIHPQYANIPYSELFPAAYPPEYKEFLKRNALQYLFERQLESARSQEEYGIAFRTLVQTTNEYQAAFLQTEQCKDFLRKFTAKGFDSARDHDSNFFAKKYVRVCLAYMPGGRALEELIFAEDIEQEILGNLNSDDEFQLDSLDYLRTLSPTLVSKVLQSGEGQRFLGSLRGEAIEDAKELLMELPDGEALIKILPKEGEQGGDD